MKEKTWKGQEVRAKVRAKVRVGLYQPAVGSEPGDSTKMSGEQQLESL